MKLFFIDDVYFKKNGKNFTAIGGIIIDYKEYLKLRNEFVLIKTNSQFNLCCSDAIKWSPDKKDRRYINQANLGKGKQNELKIKVLDLISSKDLKIIACFIDRDSDYCKSEIDAKRRAIEYLAQRFQWDIQGKDNGIIVCDSLSTDTPFLAESYKDIWHVPKYGSMDCLFDSLFFSHSFGCIGIQLADFVIGSMQSAIKDSRFLHYTEHYKKKIRKSPSDTIKGYGIVMYPSNSPELDNFIINLK